MTFVVNSTAFFKTLAQGYLQSHIQDYVNQYAEVLGQDTGLVMQTILALILFLFAIPFVFRQLKWAIGFLIQVLVCIGLLFIINQYSDGCFFRAIAGMVDYKEEDIPRGWKNNIKEDQIKYLRENEGGMINGIIMGIAGMFAGALFGNRRV